MEIGKYYKNILYFAKKICFLMLEYYSVQDYIMNMMRIWLIFKLYSIEKESSSMGNTIFTRQLFFMSILPGMQ
jgi:hypothetical protein